MREEEGRAKGHGNALHIQGSDKGTVVLQQPLANGQYPKSTSQFMDMGESSQYHQSHVHQHCSREVCLPKAVFPKFDGSHPKVWKEKCEKYFNMYQVPFYLWSEFATIHFQGGAALWLQTYEAQHPISSWPELCIAVESKFGRDLYHNSMNELLQIRQHTDVQEYYDRFESAMHKVLVHNRSLDDVFFVSKFLQGLNADIRSAIILHKPRTVDAALSLALMQAQVLETQTKPFFKRSSKDFHKNPGRPNIINQPGILGPAPLGDNKSKWEDKVADLRSQRRSQGLCMKCGEKWSRQHKCPEKVSLRVLEELLQVISPEDEEDEQIYQLSNSAAEGVQGRKTIKLHGLVNNQEILILIDSGSSCTFISEQTAKSLQCTVSPTQAVSVTVANGHKLTSDQQVVGFTWWTQGHTFSHSARVLDIPYFDLVLGMDWLEAHSPMWIHWKRKLLRFSHAGQRIALKGIKDTLSQCPEIKLKKLKGLVKRGGVAQVIHLCPVI